MIAFRGSSHNYYLLTDLFVKQFINVILFTLQVLCKTEVAIMLFDKNKGLRNTNHCGHGTKFLGMELKSKSFWLQCSALEAYSDCGLRETHVDSLRFSCCGRTITVLRLPPTCTPGVVWPLQLSCCRMTQKQRQELIFVADSSASQS